MKKPERISVIIPAYNAAAYIVDAIESIEHQQYLNMEIIVVDDGSTDDTVARCTGQNITLIAQSNQGVAAARNTGLQRASGDLIGFLDADDQWCPNKIELQLQTLREEPDIQLVMGLLLPVDKDMKPLNEPMFLMLPGVLLLRREVLDEVGTFDEQLAHGEDIDWLLRCMEQGFQIKIINEVILHYRRHDNNLTNDRETANKFFLKVLKKSLDRRRKDAGLSDGMSKLDIPETGHAWQKRNN